MKWSNLKLIRSLELRADPDPRQFESKLRSWLRNRSHDSLQYLSERPDLLRLDHEEELEDLAWLLRWLEEREEYECCAALVKVRAELVLEHALLLAAVSRDRPTS